MKKLVAIVLALILCLSAVSCAGTASKNGTGGRLVVAVGIVPLASFVKAVGGDLVDVVTMIPPGNSPENYQPTMQVMRTVSDARLYFSLDLPTETAGILPKLPEFNKNIRIVDLQEAVAKAYPLLASAHHDEDEYEDEHGDVDHHIWLSPRRAVTMVKAVAAELSAMDEKNRSVYEANALRTVGELEALDHEIAQKLSSLKNRSFIIYHAAYAYFADDYDLDMVNIQIAGKQATASDLRRVIDYAKTNKIKTVFYQQEFDSNQAQTVASEIGGVAVSVEPLSGDYAAALRRLVDALLATGR